MNRRDFSAGTACLIGAAALGLPSLASAQRRPEEGKEYRKLDKQLPVEAPAGKIEVVEFFWYSSCPHCNAFEPKLVSWIRNRGPDVFVRRVPVAFRDDFVPQQRLFYALEAMNKLDLHSKVFEAIHGQKNPLNREEMIPAFVAKNGVDQAKFKELYNSFAISTKARRAAQLQDAYKVEGVPAPGVAGRYYVDAELAGNMDKALVVTDYLVAEARKAK
ncbi:thiol:disulfide interchange protein DsbA/DsbL [Ramlibacter terrae]|uniref:Thiol:disulfide interchange protein n=1 Tax=Ramlibacter terrae TaxID=2732511 RepID=A0ABX6P060_9BURK|nr:thiol:disulfide interchange protein DsbA/DsbL [Ramlibacter terrae]